MLVLDENIIESQAQLLRSWRLSPRQIGVDVGRAGMKDDEVIPLLHSLHQPTFFTRDLRFFERDEPHRGYCIVVLAVGQNEVASFARRVWRHEQFDTFAKRRQKLIYVQHSGLQVKELNRTGERKIVW